MTTLDPVLLSAIGDLELVARVTVDGTVSGLHRSPFHGYSAEFSQYRHYRPGDDLKYVDWKLFARTDRLYTKQYRETTNMVAQVASTRARRWRIGSGPALQVRVRAAAGRRARAPDLVSGRRRWSAGYSDHLVRYIPSRTGPSHLRALLIALAKMEAIGRDVGGGLARPGHRSAATPRTPRDHVRSV